MGHASGRCTRGARAFCVGLALVATLFAAGVPLAHARAHDLARHDVHAVGHTHGPEGHPSGPAHGNEHEEIHPDALHDEGVIGPRPGFGPVAAAAAEPYGALIVSASAVPRSRAPAALHSRGPPRTTPARAPPLR